MHNIAIVTGASSGLGREFTRQLDMGAGGPLDELWVIARNAQALDEVAEDTHTATKVLALDLTQQSSFDAITQALEQAGDDLNVQWLVNCAGYGKFGSFQEVGDDNANMVRLNCLAVVELCYRALLHMHAGSRIVNIASAAAIVPQPGLSVYAATKRFVLDFSRSLDAELGSSGIHTTAVCPKFMHTKFLDSPGDHGALDRVLWIGFEDPKTCVTQSLRAAVRGQRVCITSTDVRLMNAAAKVLPTDAVMFIQERLGDYLSKRRAEAPAPKPQMAV